MIITIARQCGCMGDEIGQRLADEYGLTFYNKEHIVKLAKEKGIYDRFPYFFSEIPVNALMHSISSDENNVLLSEARKALYPIIGDGVVSLPALSDDKRLFTISLRSWYITDVSGIKNIIPRRPKNLPPKNTAINVKSAGSPTELPTTLGYMNCPSIN